MIGILILLGHVAIFAVGAFLGLTERHNPARGDPRTLFGGAFFLYWAAVMYGSARTKTDDWLLNFLNRRGNALLLSALFGVLGCALFFTGLFRGAP